MRLYSKTKTLAELEAARAKRRDHGEGVEEMRRRQVDETLDSEASHAEQERGRIKSAVDLLSTAIWVVLNEELQKISIDPIEIRDNLWAQTGFGEPLADMVIRRAFFLNQPQGTVGKMVSLIAPWPSIVCSDFQVVGDLRNDLGSELTLVYARVHERVQNDILDPIMRYMRAEGIVTPSRFGGGDLIQSSGRFLKMFEGGYRVPASVWHRHGLGVVSNALAALARVKVMIEQHQARLKALTCTVEYQRVGMPRSGTPIVPWTRSNRHNNAFFSAEPPDFIRVIDWMLTAGKD